MKKGKSKKMCVIVSGSVGCESNEAREITDEIFDKSPYVRSMYKSIKRRKRIINVPESNLHQKIVFLAGKPTKRACVFKILKEKGRISRSEFKKYNKWGDKRYLGDFTNEVYEEGEFYLVLKDEIAKKLKEE